MVKTCNYTVRNRQEALTRCLAQLRRIDCETIRRCILSKQHTSAMPSQSPMELPDSKELLTIAPSDFGPEIISKPATPAPWMPQFVAGQIDKRIQRPQEKS